MKELAILHFACACIAALFSSARSRSNNLLLGRVQATAGTRTVVVSDRYRTSVPPPQELPETGAQTAHQFTPCRDADIVIRNEELVANGRSYGHLQPAGAVLVDHGVVSVEAAK